MKIKIIAIFFCFIFLLSTTRVFAKVTLYLQNGNIAINSEQNVLGISSQLLALIPNKNKLNVSILNQEIDKLVVFKESEGTEIESEDGVLVITSGDAKAQTNLPVFVEQKDGKIYIGQNTNAQVLNLLPSDAKKAIEDSKKTIDKIPIRLTLRENNAEIVYEYSKEQEEKLFGFIPLSTKITTTVSAKTGEVHSEGSSWVLDFIKKIFA